jgi:hypothetical protein
MMEDVWVMMGEWNVKCEGWASDGRVECEGWASGRPTIPLAKTTMEIPVIVKRFPSEQKVLEVIYFVSQL